MNINFINLKNSNIHIFIILNIIQLSCLAQTSTFKFTDIANSPRFKNQGHNNGSLKSNGNLFIGQRNAALKGHAIINGEYVETNRILLQRKTQFGVSYFPYGKPKIAVFNRKQNELNKRYIIFQDPYLPPGEGYYVVLKKIPNKVVHPSVKLMTMALQSVAPQIPYEAFHLQLSNNVHGSIDRLNVRRLAYDIRTKFSDRKSADEQIRWETRAHSARKSRLSRRRTRINNRRGKRNVPVNTDDEKSKRHLCYMIPLNITSVRIKSQDFEN